MCCSLRVAIGRSPRRAHETQEVPPLELNGAPRAGRRYGAGALVTSGQGPGFGGIGMVSESLARGMRALGPVQVWRHHHAWPRAVRRLALSAVAYARCQTVSYVVYDHVDLAQLHHHIKELAQRPYAVFIHGVEVWKPLSTSRREALSGASLILANSSMTVRRAREFNPWLPVPVIAHLGVRVGMIPPRVLVPRRPTVAMISRLDAADRYKGHDAVLSAWPDIKRAVPEAQLVLAGTGDDVDRLVARIRDEGLADVEMRGFISDRAKWVLLSQASLFLQPSSNEGFGLSAIEALGAGVPVLALRGSVLEELFGDKEGVFFARTQEPHELLNAIVPLLKTSTQAQVLARAGRNRVLKEFLTEHCEHRIAVALAKIQCAAL